MLKNEVDQQTRNTQEKLIPNSTYSLLTELSWRVNECNLAIGSQGQDFRVHDDRRNTLSVICSCSVMFNALQ